MSTADVKTVNSDATHVKSVIERWNKNMKKAELIELGIDEEVAKKILAINGTDIENAKEKATQAADKTQEIENLKSQLSEKDKLIEEANSQIENFKGMDVEGIKKAADDYKTKYEQSAADLKAKDEEYKKQLETQQYDFKVKEFVNSQKFTSDFAKKAFENEFKAQGFKIGEDGNFMGANDYIKSFSEKNTGVFAVEETKPTEPTPRVDFSAPTGGQPKESNLSSLFNFTTLRPKQ
jgi:hypothetical protein